MFNIRRTIVIEIITRMVKHPSYNLIYNYWISLETDINRFYQLNFFMFSFYYPFPIAFPSFLHKKSVNICPLPTAWVLYLELK